MSVNHGIFIKNNLKKRNRKLNFDCDDPTLSEGIILSSTIELKLRFSSWELVRSVPNPQWPTEVGHSVSIHGSNRHYLLSLYLRISMDKKPDAGKSPPNKLKLGFIYLFNLI